MTDNVVYFNRHLNGHATEDRAAEKAEQHRQEMAGRVAKEAAGIREWLRTQKRVPPRLRTHFGKVVYRMFKELEEKAGKAEVVAVLAEAGEGGGDSTKFRGRFAQDAPIKTPLITPLAASGVKWLNVVCAAGRRLRGQDQALVDLVAGTDYAGNSSPILGGAGDDAIETASHLNLLASWVSARHSLKDYFNVLRHSDYVMDGGAIVVPEIPPLYANPDALADGFQLSLNDVSILAFIPQVLIVNLSIARVPAVGTVGERAEPSFYPAHWDAVANEEGVEEFYADLDVKVSLGIAPLECGADPVACFILSPVITFPLLEARVEVSPPIEAGWIPFHFERDGQTCWSAIRITEWPENAGIFADLMEGIRTDAVTGSSCLQWLGGICRFDQHELHIAGSDGDIGGEELPPTSAPNRTLLAVIQRNLVYAPAPMKLSTLLDEDAKRLVGLLEATRLRERGRFVDAMAPILATWQDDSQKD